MHIKNAQGVGGWHGNFEFTTGVTEKVNRKFNVGAFSEPMTLDSMNIEDLAESTQRSSMAESDLDCASGT